MHYYSAIDPDGKRGMIRYIIWSEVLICPCCGKEISFFESGTKRNPVTFEKNIICPHCKMKSSVDEMQFQTEEYKDALTGKYTVRKNVFLHGFMEVQMEKIGIDRHCLRMRKQFMKLNLKCKI